MRESFIKFNYHETSPLLNDILKVDLKSVESSGAEFRATLAKKRTRKPSKPDSEVEYKTSIRNMLLRSRRPQRDVREVQVQSDGDSSGIGKRFYVEDVILQARRSDGREMYLCLWGGFGPAEASWVSDRDLNSALKEWWLMERENRYPLYSDTDFLVYETLLDADSGSESKRFDSVPLEVLDSNGILKKIIFSNSSESDSQQDSGLMFQGHRAYYVDEILAERKNRSLMEYLVKWVGYETPTWIPEENINDVALETYRKKKRKR